MLVKRYKLSGLNLRDSDINTPSEYSTDLQNVELDDRRRLVKRNGFEESEAVNPSLETLGLFEYVKGNILIKFYNTFGLSPDDAINSYVNPLNPTPIEYTVCPDTAEYNGVMYFTDPDLVNPLYKYDGNSFHRAGMAAMENHIDKSLINSGSTYYYRIQYLTVDAQKNIINGDYYQFGSTDSALDGVNTVVDSLGGLGYKSMYVESVSYSSGALSFRKGDPDVTLNFTGGLFAQDGIVLMARVGREIEETGSNSFSVQSEELGLIKVVNVDTGAGEITISSELLDEGQVYVLDGFGNGSGSLFSLAVRIYSSNDESFGYARSLSFDVVNSGVSTFPIYQSTEDSSSTLINYTFFDANSAADDNYILMEDEYDSTIIKGEPPKCKYVTIYNNVMILANTLDAVARYQDKESSIFWSDTGIGSTVETFPPLNTDTVGISSEGPINGIFALDDNIVIGKERQTYYVNGSLILQNYRIRSALSNGIGCVSYRSMIEVDGGVLYMTQKGLHLAYSGQNPLELSSIIEPLFFDTDLDLTKSESINDRVREKLYIHIPHSTDNIILVYDYRYKEWFLHRGINANGGFAMLINDMYHSDGSTIYLRNSSYSDNGNAITSYYKTAWENQGSPSLVKKWKKAVVISIGDFKWELNLKHQVDWIDQDVTDYRRDIGPVMVDDYSLNMSQKYAMRLEFGNDKLDEGMLITGYEYEFEHTQERPKGDS